MSSSGGGGCCKPELWTKIIGFVELIFTATCTVFFGYYLQKYVSGGEKVVETASQTNYAVAQYYLLGYQFLIAVLAILFVVSVLGVLMSVILIKAGFKRNFRWMFFWMIYAIGSVGIIFLILLTYGGYVWDVVLRSFIFVSIRSLMVWSVFVDMKDIEAEVLIEDKTGLKDVRSSSDIDTTSI